MITFKSNKNTTLLKCICEKQPQISFGVFNKLLRKKDIKVNGKRVAGNVSVVAGDLIEVYYVIPKPTIEIMYQDDNVVIVDKPINIEVVDGEGDTLQSVLCEQLNMEVYAVHRLDRNTRGLIIFAKTLQAKEELEKAFKEHYIKKYYLAEVTGAPKKEAKLKAYIFKDEKKSQCYIENQKTNSNKEIITNYRLLKSNGGVSLLEVEIPTGRTHQIRAHLAAVGLPVLGDNKYGDIDINKKYKLNRQQLKAYKLKFELPISFSLAYLNDKDIELEQRV